MLDYKTIIIKRYALNLSGTQIAKDLGCSKSGVNDFLKRFEECKTISFPLPDGITNYGIAELVYGKVSGQGIRNETFVLPNYAEVHQQMISRKNMTLIYQWNRYKKKCEKDNLKYYSYRQFCERYGMWCNDNEEDAHFSHVIAQTMEVDFAGKTFEMIDRLTGEIMDIVVFVAVLPYSQMIYAEGMVSTKEPQWIQVNNNALKFYGGVPAIVVCDNCKQAVVANDDWIHPTLNKDYADWAEHNGTAIVPAKVRKPKFKSSVENAVGILEKGFFHDLEDRKFFSLEQFNEDLWYKLGLLNHEKMKNKEHSRYYYWEEERDELMPLPPAPYEYMERKEAKVSSDFHIRFGAGYYSVDTAAKHQHDTGPGSPPTGRKYARNGKYICEHQRATRKGQWCTNPEHLPKSYNDFREWNAEFFISKAMTIGPNTVDVIKTVLHSREQEVQTYRLCLGIIGFAKKYSREALEECCRQAIKAGKPNYTFIKNSIPVVAEDFVAPDNRMKINANRNKGAYIMSAEAMDVDNLLSKSRNLASKRKEAEANE